jgi:chromosome segregation ATPase
MKVRSKDLEPVEEARKAMADALKAYEEAVATRNGKVADALNGLEPIRVKYNAAVDTANAAIEAAMDALSEVRDEYNSAVSETNDAISEADTEAGDARIELQEAIDATKAAVQDVASGLRDAYDAKSEKWQESDAGTEALALVEAWEGFDIESVDEPSETESVPEVETADMPIMDYADETVADEWDVTGLVTDEGMDELPEEAS